MMPVIRVSDETFARLKRHAKPFEDTTPESVIVKALTALEMADGEASPQPAATAKRTDAPKLPQKEFRVPLLMTLLKFGGGAQAKDVRNTLGPIMAPRLAEGDYETVSTGDPRWWNAACWERNDLVKDGLMRDDSDRGVWEISEEGKMLAASLHLKENNSDRVVAHGPLHEMAARYWRRPIGPRPFIMVGDVVFDAVMLRRVDELSLSVRTASCLKNDDITYIGEAVQKTEAEMLRIPNFGRRSLNELNEELAQFNLRIGMLLPGPIKDFANL